MADDNTLTISAIADHQTTYVVLASQRSEIEKLGITCSAEAVGHLNSLGEDLILPVVSFEHELLGEFIEDLISKREAPTSICHIAEKAYVFIALKDGVVEKTELYAEQEDPVEWGQRYIESALNDIHEFATCAGGLTVYLHPPTDSKFHEPFRDEDGVFHLFIITTPSPHRGEQQYPQTMFDLCVETPAGFYSHLNPTLGRGVILSEGKRDIAQIIGNNIYLPWDPITLMTGNTENGVDIFRKTLTIIFNHLLSRKKETAHAPEEDSPLTEENIRANIDAYAEKGLSNLRKDLVAQVGKVRDAEAKLRILKEELADSRRLSDMLTRENFLMGPLCADLLRNRERILANRMIEAVRVTAHGFDLDTKMIRIVHEGKSYRIGTFTMRFDFSGKFSIWTKEPLHPRSVPHPHISAWNGPCFGNASETISDAVIEFRYGDAVEYLLDWLENGYSPELVIWNKLEEWPTEDSCTEAVQ